MLLACLVWLPAHAAERAIDKSVAIPATLDRVWGHVLVNLKRSVSKRARRNGRPGWNSCASGETSPLRRVNATLNGSCSARASAGANPVPP